jgi:L-ribulokinase
VAASTEVPARGSALFGAVAAGAFDDIGAAIAATRPGTGKTYTPDRVAQAVYDEVYAIYREVYETLGRTQAELLHGLKRIRTNQRRAS